MYYYCTQDCVARSRRHPSAVSLSRCPGNVCSVGNPLDLGQQSLQCVCVCDWEPVDLAVACLWQSLKTGHGDPMATLP